MYPYYATSPHQVSYPASHGFSPLRLIRSLFCAFGGLFSLAGLLMIGHMLAPNFTNQLLPGWQARYGAIIAAAVIFGFIRSVWRLFVPIVSLGFWITAIIALMQTTGMSPQLPKLSGFSLPSISAAASAHVPRSAPQIIAVSSQVKAHGTPSLPDSAYFAASPSIGGSLSRLPVIGNVLRMLRR